MSAWNGWYHVESHTYGNWLRGDPRGWRTRHHREHVEGDYKNPPAPGTYEALYLKSKRLQKYPSVHLSSEQRQVVGRAIVEVCQLWEVELIAVSMDAVHLHMLARFGDRNMRTEVGRIKKHAYHVVQGNEHTGSLWETRSQVVPVKDRRHQVNVYNYVLRHANKGAWVWKFKDGIYWR